MITESEIQIARMKQAFWKEIAAEKKARKRESWSAHVAWGIVFVWGFVGLGLHPGWAALISAGFGAAWELTTKLWWRRSKPSVVDLAFWWIGTVAGIAAVVWVF